MGRMGHKETDAPWVPALQPWQGRDTPCGCRAPLLQPMERGKGFSPWTGRNKTLPMLISRAPVKHFRDFGGRKEEKLFYKPRGHPTLHAQKTAPECPSSGGNSRLLSSPGYPIKQSTFPNGPARTPLGANGKDEQKWSDAGKVSAPQRLAST